MIRYRILWLCLLGTITLQSHGWGAIGPSLLVTPMQADLGEIRQGKRVEQVYLLKNTGEQPLVIGQVKTSCGCTVVVPEKTTLAPGESTHMTAEFNSSGFRGDIRKSIFIQSNDTKRPKIELLLTGRVVLEVEVQPTVLDVGQLSYGVPTTRTVYIMNHGATPVTIRKIEVMVKDVTVAKPEQEIPGGSKASLDITFSPSAPNSYLNGYLIITTSRPDLPPLKIPIFATTGN